MTFLWSLIQGSALKIALYAAMAGIVLAVLIGVRQSGKNAVLEKLERKALKIKDAQLRAAADRPRTREDLVDRLRKGEF